MSFSFVKIANSATIELKEIQEMMIIEQEILSKEINDRSKSSISKSQNISCGLILDSKPKDTSDQKYSKGFFIPEHTKHKKADEIIEHEMKQINKKKMSIENTEGVTDDLELKNSLLAGSDIEQLRLNEEEKLEYQSKAIIKSFKFFIVYFSICHTYGICTLFMNYFKIFSLMYYDDSVATDFSSLSTIALLTSQAYYGILMDKYGFQICIYNICGSGIIAIVLLNYFYDNLALYYLSFILFYSLYGAADIIYLGSAQKIWGIELGMRLFTILGYAYLSGLPITLIYEY